MEKINRWFFNVITSTLAYLSRIFEQISRYLAISAFRLRIPHSKSTIEIGGDLVGILESDVTNKLQLRAEGYAKTLSTEDAHLKNAVELYFLTKQAIIFYDAKVSAIPTQIFNELRSALDHYMRSLILLNENGTVPADEQQRYKNKLKHIDKMEGHLQRALLDVVKLGCARINEEVDKTHSRFGEKAVSAAKEGQYAIQIFGALNRAEDLLIEAKSTEAALGGKNDKNIRHAFIKAFAAYVSVSDFQKKSLPSLWYASFTVLRFGLWIIVLTIMGKLAYDLFARTSLRTELITFFASLFGLTIK